MKRFRYTLLKPDLPTVRRLSEEINVSEPIAAALVNRGITTFEEAKRFFRPDISQLHHPFLMKGMQDAVSRIITALKENESVMIYGDYDVDGTTGTSILYLFLQKIIPLIGSKSSVWYYINDRRSEGYGVAISGLENAVLIGASLVISVDCGITAIEPAQFCRENGIDFIICDHHQPPLDLPNAHTILNPKQEGCTYPFKELSGCGVAFKLMQALCIALELPMEYALEQLDYVALAAAADIVEMMDENRILMAEGLRQITARNPRPPLRALAVEAGLELGKSTSSSVVFTLAPRINAAGRLGHARDAIKWLTATTEEEAAPLAAILNEQNALRRELDKEIFQSAEKMAEMMLSIKPLSSLVLYNPDWHLGVIGIVASKIVERFYLPTIILTENRGVLKGSARSVSGVNIYQAISMAKTHLIQFGGHDFAAGLSLEIEKLDAFRNAFDAACDTLFPFEFRTPEIVIDAEVLLDMITPKFFQVLMQFEPYGPKNLKPVFLTKGVRPYQKPQLLKDLHLKMSFLDSSGRVFDAIGFNMPDQYKEISDGLEKNSKSTVQLVYSLEENEWNGQTKLQLRLRDARME
ncbi:MAG: single-stranded-DNA-specific exonuclease RecJ [Chloroherpetonaceae bacterium]|nr:single-stranded-DNA-specific exonuclease RecJ [Chloroherpetonaceae bacterium]